MADDWEKYIELRCVVGSRAYGLETPESDEDVRGFFVPPTSSWWHLEKPPEQLECDERQECFWEVEKFLRLALNSNPNVLECLTSPVVQYAGTYAQWVLAERSAFLSKLAYERYLKYAEGQMRRLDNRRDASGEVNWRHAMHMVRLLISGEHLLRTGEVRVDVREHRTLLLGIRKAELTWPEVQTLAKQWEQRLEEAFRSTTLPDQPDTARANALLFRIRGAQV